MLISNINNNNHWKIDVYFDFAFYFCWSSLGQKKLKQIWLLIIACKNVSRGLNIVIEIIIISIYLSVAFVCGGIASGWGVLQWLPGYLGLNLVFVSGGAQRGEFGFCFHFGRGTGRWAIISWGLLIFRVSGRSATREAFGKSFGNSHIPCLSVIIAHRFTCGERKI